MFRSFSIEISNDERIREMLEEVLNQPHPNLLELKQPDFKEQKEFSVVESEENDPFAGIANYFVG